MICLVMVHTTYEHYTQPYILPTCISVLSVKRRCLHLPMSPRISRQAIATWSILQKFQVSMQVLNPIGCLLSTRISTHLPKLVTITAMRATLRFTIKRANPVPAYILRAGKTPAIVLYSSCEDELLCRAELVLFLEMAEHDQIGEGHMIVGRYDVDPAFTIDAFQLPYRTQTMDYKRLMALRSQILREGWSFPALPLGMNP